MSLKETFSKQSEFYKLKELLAPTLVPFSLWLAIGAFAASLLLGFNVDNIKWLCTVVLQMSISDATADFVHWIFILVLGTIFLISMLIITVMFVRWIGVNTIRVGVSTIIWIVRGISTLVIRLKSMIKSKARRQ